MGELTTTQQGRLEELVTVIENGMRSYLEVGNALTEIRDDELWRDTHDTFELFCRERWEFSSKRAIQLINTARVDSVLADRSENPRPRNEGQARVLTKVSGDDLVVEVWDYAVETAPVDGHGVTRMSALHIEKCRVEMLGGGKKETPPPTPKDRLGRDVETALVDAHGVGVMLREAMGELLAVSKKLEGLTGRFGAEWLDIDEAKRVIEEARLVCKQGAYHTTCPVCRGRVGEACDVCDKAGYIVESTFKRLTEEQRSWLST
jgi:hypothetical protein